MANNDFNFKVPGGVQPQSPSAQGTDNSEGTYKKLLGDKPITLLWLLQHYSSENAAAYKAQKAARKQSVPPARPMPPAANSTPPPQPYQAPKVNAATPAVSASRGYSSAQRSANGSIANNNIYSGGSANGYGGVSANSNAGGQNSFYGGSAQADNYGGTMFVAPNAEPMKSGVSNDFINMPKAAIVFVSYNRRIEITKPVVLLGRDSTKADIRMLDAPTVSSLHAKITCENGSFFITDLNSLNGTAIDGRRISSNTPVAIKDNCSIKLGEEKLLFREYN